MENCVHVDEKYFYIKPMERSILLPLGETHPQHMKAKSKRYIIKVMILAAAGKQRWNLDSNYHFDGKIVLRLVKRVENEILEMDRKVYGNQAKGCKWRNLP